MTRPVLAYVAHSLNPGGTERLVVDMAIALRDEFDCRVWCIDEPGAWATTLRDAGVPVRGLWRQPGVDLALAARLAQELRESNANIVHAHQCTPWFYAALARFSNRSPRLLLEEHGRFWPERDSRMRRLVNRIAIVPMTHRVVAVSDDVARRLARYEGIPAARIDVIRNGVEPAAPCAPEERARRRTALGFGPGDVVVGTVGRFDPIKNLPRLVEAIAMAARTRPHLRALLVGDGPHRADVERLLRDAGLEQRVVLTGHRDDARRLVDCIDTFVLPSLSEGVSVALLEAMSAGLPVIVTAVGGNVEVVTDGQEGWLVPSDDATALATAIGVACDRPDLREARGLEARARFESAFSFARMLDGYRGLYRQMLGERIPGVAIDRARTA